MLHNKLEYIFSINYQRFCKQWYDQAAQPKNIFSQRKSWAEKGLILIIFNKFLFYFAWVIWDNC